MSGNINILFFSRKCETCINLINILRNTGFLQYFKMWCVDDDLDRIPAHITRVPTMITTNTTYPLVGPETFKWVNTMKFMRQKYVLETQKKIIKMNLINMAKHKDGLVGFQQQEMNGISDPYAFTQKDVPMRQLYINVGDENAIATFEEGMKLTEVDQENKLKELESSRNEIDTHYKDKMARDQMAKVMMNEKQNVYHNMQ